MRPLDGSFATEEKVLRWSNASSAARRRPCTTFDHPRNKAQGTKVDRGGTLIEPSAVNFLAATTLAAPG
eukprot:359469-Chlamydomonas_euryale.AAC.2